MKNTLTPELLQRMDAYWRAANYLSVGQIYLFDNPLLKRPLTLADVKHMLLGHWGTTPGQNFIYVHLNRVIKKYDLDMIYVSGPGHGGPAVVANTYLEGTYSEIYPDISQDEAGLQKLFLQFSFPGGIPSHASPECPGSIHEGGELGYSLSHSFGAVFDNPELVVACVVGDGEAETGPLATAWHSNKFLNPATDGAVLPILHLNGYKIANPTILARIPRDELIALFDGYGYRPVFVEGHDPAADAGEPGARVLVDVRVGGRDEPEARTERVVEAHTSGRPVDHSLDEQLTRARRAREDDTVADRGERRDVGDAAVVGRDERLVSGSCVADVGDADQLAHVHRQLDDRLGMGASLASEGVEQGVRCVAAKDEVELPRQVRRVAKPGAQALPGERRGLVRGVAGQQDATATPLLDPTGLEPVDRVLFEHGVVGAVPGGEELADVIQRGGAEVFHRADGGPVVRVVGVEPEVQQALEGGAVGDVVVALAALFLDHLALDVELLLRQSREEKAHAVRLHP